MREAITTQKSEAIESPMDRELRKIDAQLSEDPETDPIFISRRLQELVTPPQREISLSHNPTHSGFISPETDIRRNFIVDPLRIDDEGIYSELMRTLREFRVTPGWGAMPIRSFYLQAVQYAVGRYFGGFSGDDWKNKEMYLDKSGSESVAISVAEFKSKGIAVCAEKAPVAQNLMAFAGMDTTLIATERCRLPADAKAEAHYFNLFTTDKGTFIFDPTNPSILQRSDGSVEAVSPSLHKLTDEQHRSLLAGGETSVTHRDGKRDEAGSIMTTERVFIYGDAKK